MTYSSSSTLLSNLDQALHYLNQGYSIFPLLPDSKRPNSQLLHDTHREGSWKSFQLSPPSRDEVIWWFTSAPEANIAIVTGQVSNLIVIDIDTKLQHRPHPVLQEQAHSLLNDLTNSSPSPTSAPTFTVSTPSQGFHLYYRFDTPSLPPLFTKNHTALLPSIDIRSQGGYVVAPPSATSDGSYNIISNLSPSHLPYQHAMFHDLIASSQSSSSILPKRSPQEWESFITSAHPSGQRNSDLTSLIGKLLRHLHHALSPKTIYTLISSYNQTHVSPPLTQDELDRTFLSILKRYE